MMHEFKIHFSEVIRGMTLETVDWLLVKQLICILRCGSTNSCLYVKKVLIFQSAPATPQNQLDGHTQMWQSGELLRSMYSDR